MSEASPNRAHGLISETGPNRVSQGLLRPKLSGFFVSKKEKNFQVF
jgi:hypothetical protein